MDNKRSIYHLAVVTVFVGLLLTFAIIYITGAVIRSRGDTAKTCYDGSVIEGKGFFRDFSRAVYQSSDTLERVRKYQYLLFDSPNDRNVIAGSENFLFEIEDPDNDYDYLADYLGLERFSDKELAGILRVLQQRKASYAARGTEYLLVILPNSQTVYSEYMPANLGDIRETRLDALEDYLLENGFTDFANLTDELIAAKDTGLLYNNTENSLNALGLYYVYTSVCARFSDDVMNMTHVIPQNELVFYQHMTAGKAVARRAGLADVVPNRTVSLSNDTALRYHKYDVKGTYVSSTTLIPFEGIQTQSTPSLLLQFSGTWERLQAEPFFSNTFSRVTYQTDFADDPAIFSATSPRVVVQFLYEDQLSWLVPHITA